MTQEPDERKLHVRLCGEGAGQLVPLPGRATPALSFLESWDQILVLDKRYKIAVLKKQW